MLVVAPARVVPAKVTKVGVSEEFLEVIGEAAKRVSAGARDCLASLDWKAICGMRDVLIHDSIGVDLDEVWNVESSRIPELQAALEQFLAGEGPGVDGGLEPGQG